MKPSYRMEPLSETLQVCVSPEHGFGTDAFLLTDFSRYRRKDLVCDLGTGCGIIPMIMQRQDPPKQVYGVDIQPQAIEQFQQSVQASGVSHVTPICADLRTLWAGAPMQCCDLVTCNPANQLLKFRRVLFRSSQSAVEIRRQTLYLQQPISC